MRPPRASEPALRRARIPRRQRHALLPSAADLSGLGESADNQARCSISTRISGCRTAPWHVVVTLAGSSVLQGSVSKVTSHGRRIDRRSPRSLVDHHGFALRRVVHIPGAGPDPGGNRGRVFAGGDVPDGVTDVTIAGRAVAGLPNRRHSCGRPYHSARTILPREAMPLQGWGRSISRRSSNTRGPARASAYPRIHTTRWWCPGAVAMACRGS